jgi:hypothetical protein
MVDAQKGYVILPLKVNQPSKAFKSMHAKLAQSK